MENRDSGEITSLTLDEIKKEYELNEKDGEKLTLDVNNKKIGEKKGIDIIIKK